MKTNKQIDRVRDRLESGYPVTSLDAFHRLGIVHLPGVIRDLRKTGYEIRSEWIKVKNRFGERCKVKVYRKEDGLQRSRL